MPHPFRPEGFNVEISGEHVEIVASHGIEINYLTVDEAEWLYRELQWAVANIRYNQAGAEG